MLDPFVFLAVFGTFLIVVLCSKIVSLASLSAAVVFPIAMFLLRWLQHSPDFVFEGIFAVVIAALIIFMHRQNINRLVHGTENKFGKKKQG